MQKLAAGSYYGEQIERQTAGGFVLTECGHAPHHRIPPHVHEIPYFCFVVQGAVNELAGGRSRTLPALTLTFHPAGEMHANEWHPEGGRCFNLEMTPPTLERLRTYSPFLDQPRDFHEGLPIWLTLRLHHEFQRRDAASFLAMEGLALELLAEASRPPASFAERRPPRWLRLVRDRLHEEFAASLSLGEIAGAAGVHPAHLVRVFRQQYRCTIGDYVRKLRIEFACRQLATSETPLVEIALSAGFADQSHFSRTFKCHTGLSPGEFRRSFHLRNSRTTE